MYLKDASIGKFHFLKIEANGFREISEKFTEKLRPTIQS